MLEHHFVFTLISPNMIVTLAICFVWSCFWRMTLADFRILETGFLANTSTVALSANCVGALESSVACDQYLQDNAYNDAYGPLDTTLQDSFCTTDCKSTLVSYRSKVISACAHDPEPYPGTPAQYFVDVVWAQYNLTCLKDPSSGQYCNSMYAWSPQSSSEASKDSFAVADLFPRLLYQSFSIHTG